MPVNYPGAGRRVYPGFLQHAGFIAMNPDRHLKSHYDYFLDLVRGDGDNADFHRGFYDEYNAVLDMPAEYYLDTIKTVFQDFALVNGTWTVRGQPVRPQDITHGALLTIEGELDDISGAGQTKAAHALCTGIPADRRFHYDAIGAGHYGIFSGRRWREKVYPKVRDFIAAHQGDADRQPTRSAARAQQASRRERLIGAGDWHLPVEAVLDAAAADAMPPLRLRRLPRLRDRDRRRRRRRSIAARRAAPKASHASRASPAGRRGRSTRRAAPRRRALWRRSTKRGASVARSACRRARSTRSSARPSACTPSSTRSAPAASCACRSARSTASR